MKVNYSNKEILSMVRLDRLDALANQLEDFLTFVDTFLFFEGMTKKEYKKTRKKMKKIIKRFRKRKKLYEVLNIDNIEKYAIEDSQFSKEYLNE